ncbi:MULTISPECIES: SRPBCC domain-containing protein [unclassified Streptomyces]|uniref:SRPBCC domain-containing protein n=1 Tax=unclassified Streptomyces TaxID=2593676 RepID=UPI0033A261C8
MSDVIEEGTAETRGDLRLLHYLLRLPRPVEDVWPAVATAEGLREWLAGAVDLEPRLGGAARLGELGEGRVTAWDVERVAEYTAEERGRIRFHLEAAPDGGTTLRFTHETRSGPEPGWRARLERLVTALARD